MLSHWAACFALLQVGRRNSITRVAASAKVGTDGAGLRAASRASRFSATGSRPWATAVPIVVGDGAGSGKTDSGVRPQPHVSASSIDDDSLDPRFAAGRGDVEVEAVAIAVPAGLAQGPCRQCGELAHSPILTTLIPTQ